MSTSRYAVVRRLSRVLLFPLHGHTAINNHMRRRQGKDPTSAEDQRICTKENCLRCGKKFAAFMFSRVGLFLVMIGYVALGGVLFQALESGNEHHMRTVMSEKLNITLDALWKAILIVNSSPENEKKIDFSLSATRELELFERIVIQQVQQGFDGRTTDADHDWNFFGAVLYAVTLVSTIGYGHITTKTTQGKIATILYSAFGVPLMMLFVANIGSTMAKMFAFVFSRITMIVCCRMSNKKKRALVIKNRQKLLEKNNQTAITMDGNAPISASPEQTKERILGMKSNLKAIKDESVTKDTISSKPSTNHSTSESITSSLTDVNNSTDLRELPANIRLNMLTGAPNSSISHSLASSRNSIGEKSKDAIFRINELIRQSSVQDIEEINNDELPRRRSIDVSPIQYYINATNKLTSNLETPTQDKSNVSAEKDQTTITNHDENNMKQVALPEDTSNGISKKSSKKNLKRSKSESTHNRRSAKKVANDTASTNDNESPKTTAKPARRRFFSRKNGKLKKQTSGEGENNPNSLQPQTNAVEIRQINEQLPRKSQSFKEHSPPDYEQSTPNEKTPSPTTITWKGEHQFYSNNPIVDLTDPYLEDDEDFDEDEEMTVPLLVTVFVIPLYLTLGAILFSIWEQWKFLDSFYFCFITLTTIGFGDYVPGSALKVEAEKEKLISAAVYILFGLVLIAMCINLMKEQLSQKVKRVANKLGSF